MISKLFVVLLVSAAITCAAQVKTPEKSPAADYSKEAFVIEKLYSRADAKDDGSNTREVEAQIKILADAGVKAFAVLSFTYTSANEVVDVDYVRVRKPDGSVVKTPDYNIQDMPADVTRTAPMYSDIHEKHVAVKALAVGDVLEYMVRYRTIKPQVSGQFWFESNFVKDVIVEDERLEIAVPSSKYVKVSSPEFKPEVREENGRRIYSWRHSNLSRPDKTRQVRRTPPPPAVQVTTFKSWEEVGRWYGGLQKDALEVTPEIENQARRLTKDLKTDEEKIQAIYEFVSLKFHYIGLDFGIGRYQPHAADDVLSNGYGDCKDKHTLLATMLKSVGIEAWPALIHSVRKLDAEVPSPAQFNHVISVVPLHGDYIWLDTTPEVAPYRLLLLTLRDKKALVIPPGQPPVLMTTPADGPVAQLQTFTSEGKLDASGTFTGHVEQSARGDVEVVMRAVFRQVSQSQWKEAMQNLSYGLGFGGDVSNVTVDSPEETNQPFRFSYDYQRKSYSDWESRRITPPLPALGIESNKNSKKPEEDVLLGAVGEIRYRSTVTLPPGYSITAPPNVDLVKPYAEYHATAILKDGVLTTTRRLVIKKARVALADWEDYRDFGKAVSDDEYNYIDLRAANDGGTGTKPQNSEALDKEFRDGVVAQQNQDFVRAEELYRKVLAGNANYRGAHFNLALLFAARGRMGDAIQELRKEQQVNPDDARAYDMSAMFLMLQGHQEEAGEELRKLLSVEPKNHDAALKLSALLAQQSKHAEAAKVLEAAVQATPDSPSLEMALGQAYVRAGQADKGVPYIKKAIEGGAGSDKADTGMLNDAAYVLAENNASLELAREYGEKAVAQLDAESVAKADSDDAVSVGSHFPAVWDTLGWVYFRLGDTARAESFVLSAWMQEPRSAIGEHLGRIYEKMGRNRQAAKVYAQALAAQSGPDTFTQNPMNQQARHDEYEKRRNDLISRYEKLSGLKYSNVLEIKRLPNGEWSKMPFEELQDQRKVKITSTAKVSGSAMFTVRLSPGQVESVKFKSGDEALQTMVEPLKAAKFPIPFPANSGAKIVRLVKLTCTGGTCVGEFMSSTQVRLGMY